LEIPAVTWKSCRKWFAAHKPPAVVDGNIVDGNIVDGNIVDGNIVDGNIVDGNIVDGNIVDGNRANGLSWNAGDAEAKVVVPRIGRIVDTIG
jgi:hypothetical protein